MPTTARRTQDERSASTRALLLDATIACLVEVGYAATTTTLIAERAGVSRGAQMHHYKTRAELVAAAVEHLGVRIGQQVEEQTARRRRRGDADLSAAVDVLWDGFTTPLFTAWLELAVAARSDDELRAQLDRSGPRVERAVRTVLGTVFGEEAAAAPGYQQAVEMTFELMCGMALTRSFGPGRSPGRRRHEQRQLDAWKAVLPGIVAGSTPESSHTG
ncbi:MAG TPA: TetR/AcrR family transcriptional regulator [Acidimicrobiales bacterium]|jgi:AcrR family transcriptional regulator|nr:TetR/AcrR family transcriptional regulator [Acidimicrobiales bacterium]